MWDLIVSVPDHCLFLFLFYFSVLVQELEFAINRALYGLL